ncbi:hypothetical protein [Pseudomonas amygdali]|nr:hypothetical protein [Pseudomonas amygdali]
MINKKMVITVIFAMLCVFVPKSFADGGSWSVTCYRTIACPAGQTGTITQWISVNGNNVGCNANNYWGNARESSNTCRVAAPAVMFSYYGYNNSTQTCPASQPQGVINIQQNYEVWSDGSTRNASGWYETSRTCVAIKSRTQTDSRSYSCPAGQSGSITQSRTYEVWTDGTNKNFSAWNVTGNSCVSAPMTANPTQRRELCSEGFTGVITYHWVVYYTNDSYSAYDGDGKLISYVLSTPHQQELLLSNTCALIPSQGVATVAGHESVTCDKYYNVVKGTYIGEVIKYGNYVSSYDSSKKQTNTVFIVTSLDVTQCVPDPEKTYSSESVSVACDTGQSGIITKTRTVATAPNGSKSYPNGTDYTVSSNTCAGTSADAAPAAIVATTKTSLIENLSLTSSMLSDSAYSTKIVDLLKRQSIKPGEVHKLNLVINDLSTGKYNAENVTNVVKAFKTAVGNGAEFRITLPRSVDKYLGNGGIQSGKGCSLTGSQLSGSKLTVKYIDGSDKKALSMPVEKSVDIQLFNGDLTGINFGQD